MDLLIMSFLLRLQEMIVLITILVYTTGMRQLNLITELITVMPVGGVSILILCPIRG